MTEQERADFRDWVAARSADLLRMAVLLTGDRDDADDLLQTALAKLYLAWGRIADRQALDAYVYRTMANTRVTWWRRRRLAEIPVEHLPEHATRDPFAGHDDRDALRRALLRLPHRQRVAVVLRYFEQLTEAETAAVMGVTVGTVKSSVARALDKLRTDLGDGVVGPAGPASTRPEAVR